MAVQPLIIFPNKILRRVAETISDTKAAGVQQLVLDLAETLVAAKGLGLAAPQIGVNKRAIAIQAQDGVIVLINPGFTKYAGRIVGFEEGCLSIPAVFGLVKRPNQVHVEALTASGGKKNFRAEGLFARVLQHEVDHLNGILFLDRLVKFTSGSEHLRELWQEKKSTK